MHHDSTWVNTGGNSWDARHRPQRLRKRHPTDPEARDFASEDGSKHAHLSQDFAKVTSCRMQPTLEELKGTRLILQSTAEEEGESTMMGEDVARNAMAIIK